MDSSRVESAVASADTLGQNADLTSQQQQQQQQMAEGGCLMKESTRQDLLRLNLNCLFSFCLHFSNRQLT